MSSSDAFADLDALPAEPMRWRADGAAGLVASIIDEQLAGIRARMAQRRAAEQQRIREQREREQARAWWRAHEQRQSGKVTSILRRA